MREDRLTLNQAAKLAGIKPASLRQAILRERLPATQVDSGRGPLWYVTRADLEHYIATKRRTGRNPDTTPT